MDSLGCEAFSDTDRRGPGILLGVYRDSYFGPQTLHGRREDFCRDFTKQGKAQKHPGKNQRSCGKKQSPALNPGLIHNARSKG